MGTPFPNPPPEVKWWGIYDSKGRLQYVYKDQGSAHAFAKIFGRDYKVMEVLIRPVNDGVQRG